MTGLTGRTHSAVGTEDGLSITFVSTAKVWGGAEEQTRLLAGGLRSGGHDCRFVARRGSRVAERLAEEGYPVFTVLGTGRDPVSFWRVRRLLCRTRPDVVHYVDPHAVTCGGISSWGLARIARVAVRHNPFPIRVPSRYHRFCDRVICISTQVADVCRDAGLPREMLRIVYNGCLPAGERTRERGTVRRDLKVRNDEPLLLTAALFNACKGHRFLFEALKQVVLKRPKTKLALAGDGRLGDELKGLAKDLRIEPHVLFLGFRRDVPDLMAAADLFVLPSITEGMPVTRIEAMFAGCPMVTTDAGGACELLDGQPVHEPVAWVVPTEDADALAAAILQALDSDEERRLRAQRALRRAQRLLTVDRLVENTLFVYREMIGGQQGRKERRAA